MAPELASISGVLRGGAGGSLFSPRGLIWLG
jgi:hypothetical protein